MRKISGVDPGERDDVLLCIKIKVLLEELFSDSHLAEDGFLLKHLQRNRGGYVSLKLLTCLKTIKALTADWYVTLAGAMYSDLLEVNDECTKVRRIQPLPRWLLCSPTTKLLLAWNLSEMQSEQDGADQGPKRLSLSERILQKFSANGNITSCWILHPGKELPKPLQCYVKRHKALGQRLSAVVKFDSLEAVRKALNTEEDESKEEDVSEAPLGFQSAHRGKRDESSEERSEDQREDTAPEEHPSTTSGDSVQEELSPLVRAPDNTPGPCQTQRALKSSVHRSSEQISTSCASHTATAGLNQSYYRLTLSSGDSNKDCAQGPWVLRCSFAARASIHKASGHLSGPRAMQRVLRQPRGPDGTKGFHGGGERRQQEAITGSPRVPGSSTWAEQRPKSKGAKWKNHRKQ